MANRPIVIRKLGKGTGKLRVLASWKRPALRSRHKIYDAWVPGLSPSHTIRRRFESGIISWNEFVAAYLRELRSAVAQNRLKPLALLSLRRVVVLLCDCDRKKHCPTEILARAFEECRKSKHFVLSFPETKVYRKVAIFLVFCATLSIENLRILF